MQSRIKLASTTLALLLVAFMIYWLASLILDIWPYVFTDKIYEIMKPIVVNDEPHVVHVIEFGTTVNVVQHVLYGLIWIVLICITLSSFAYAIALMLRFRNGEYFTLTTTRLLRNLGLALMAANVFYNAAPSLTHIILSFRNPHGMYGPVYFYDPSSIALFLAGCGFAILGWVFTVARQIQLENQDFV